MAWPWGSCGSPLWSSSPGMAHTLCLHTCFHWQSTLVLRKLSCVPTYIFLFPAVKQWQQWWYLVMVFTILVKHLEIDRCYGRMILITRGSYCHSCKSVWKVSRWTILTKLHFSKENWTVLWDCINSNTVFDRNVSKWIVLPFYFISVVSKYFMSNCSFFTLFAVTAYG